LADAQEDRVPRCGSSDEPSEAGATSPHDMGPREPERLSQFGVKGPGIGVGRGENVGPTCPAMATLCRARLLLVMPTNSSRRRGDREVASILDLQPTLWPL
jgi:hypothetical protein